LTFLHPSFQSGTELKRERGGGRDKEDEVRKIKGEGKRAN
jgi:hypothetical protein